MLRLLSILLVCLIAFSGLSFTASANDRTLVMQAKTSVYEVNHRDINLQMGCCDGPSLHDSYHCGVGCNQCGVASLYVIVKQYAKVTRQGASLQVTKPYHLNTVLERPPKKV